MKSNKLEGCCISYFVVKCYIKHIKQIHSLRNKVNSPTITTPIKKLPALQETPTH